ncbi:MAG TPA: lysine biosynthesis protein LysW [Herpetosiphonaceae bacterium]
MSTCPECDGEVTVASDALAGEIVVCPDCQAELEIIALGPVELALAPEVEEDWGE